MTDLDFDKELAVCEDAIASAQIVIDDQMVYVDRVELLMIKRHAESLRRLKRLRELIVEGEVLYQGYTEKLYGIVEPSFSVDIAKEIRELLNIKET